MTRRPRLRYGRPVIIENGKRVRMRVHLSVVGGDTLEKSTVEYIQGGGKMLPGLEREVAGLAAGAKKKGVITAANAFGDPSLSPQKQMKKSEFPGGTQLSVGARFTAKGADNQADVVLEVIKVTADAVEVRLLHPLADKDLHFDIEVLSVSAPAAAPPPVPAAAIDLQEEG